VCPLRASAATGVQLETHVRGIELADHAFVGGASARSPEKHLGNSLAYNEIALGYALAAEGLGAAEGALGTSAPEQFFIENGVRRSLAVGEAGLSEIPAMISRPWQALVTTTLQLDQLFSPKTSVPQDSRFLSIQPPIYTPIEVQPLGLPGQVPSIPIFQVGLGDTWTWNGSSWTEQDVAGPSAPALAAMATVGRP
jgi:hypothetical protein